MNIQGAYDLHIHGGPEPIPRKYDFVTMSRRMAEAGMAGFVAKSHFYSTVPYAVLAEQYGAPVIWGSVTLNRFVGGINPNAVRASLGYRRGTVPLLRIVWMPTMHAKSNLAMLRRKGIGFDIPPEWTAGVPAPGAQPIDSIEPIDLTAPTVQDALKETFDVMAEGGVALATGHISRDEIFHIVPLAKSRGVRSIVLTHPIYASTALTDAEMRELTGEYENVFAEMCYIFMPIDGFTAEQMVAHIRAVGPERVLLCTDSGQCSMEPPDVCMQRYFDLLGEAGFDDESLRTMAVRNAETVLGLSCKGASV